MTEIMKLVEKLDRGAAPDLKQQLAARVGAPVEIDGTQVRIIGGLCAQVLTAAARKWAEDGQSFALRASEPMLADLERLGLQGDLIIQETQS